MSEEKGIFNCEFTNLVLENWDVIGEALAQFCNEINIFSESLLEKVKDSGLTFNQETWKDTLLDKLLSLRNGVYFKKGERVARIIYSGKLLKDGYIEIKTQTKPREWETKKIKIHDSDLDRVLEEIITTIKNFFSEKKNKQDEITK
ncbi:MAG: hypothetical protein ABIK93_05495 [candidate division WOR-3 bacterium]